MAYLLFILITLALLTGFFALTRYEARRGARFFEPQRAHLDRSVARGEFILQHVDFGAFLRAEVYRAANRAGHEIAHLSLQGVRAVERLLTRLVRHLRTQRVPEDTPRVSAREFVKTLSDFKGRLRETRPEVPDIR